MDTMERVEVVKPQRPKRNGPLMAAAAFALVILIGLVGAVLTTGDRDTEPANPTTTTVPATTTTVPATTTAPPEPTVAPQPVDIGEAEPIQVQNDQASRATIEFAGNASALFEGGVHMAQIEMYIEPDFNDPGVTVNLSSIDGEITSTGITDEGVEFTPTWAWTPDGDKVIVTMVGRGVSIPDTRPDVVVTVQETDSSDPVEFVLTAAAGSGRAG